VSPLVPLPAPLADPFPLLAELAVLVVLSGDRAGPPTPELPSRIRSWQEIASL
jgi:hypothetical protein